MTLNKKILLRGCKYSVLASILLSAILLFVNSSYSIVGLFTNNHAILALLLVVFGVVFPIATIGSIFGVLLSLVLNKFDLLNVQNLIIFGCLTGLCTSFVFKDIDLIFRSLFVMAGASGGYGFWRGIIYKPKSKNK